MFGKAWDGLEMDWNIGVGYIPFMIMMFDVSILPVEGEDICVCSTWES